MSAPLYYAFIFLFFFNIIFNPASPSCHVELPLWGKDLSLVEQGGRGGFSSRNPSRYCRGPKEMVQLPRLGGQLLTADSS